MLYLSEREARDAGLLTPEFPDIDQGEVHDLPTCPSPDTSVIPIGERLAFGSLLCGREDD